MEIRGQLAGVSSMWVLGLKLDGKNLKPSLSTCGSHVRKTSRISDIYIMIQSSGKITVIK